MTETPESTSRKYQGLPVRDNGSRSEISERHERHRTARRYTKFLGVDTVISLLFLLLTKYSHRAAPLPRLRATAAGPVSPRAEHTRAPGAPRGLLAQTAVTDTEAQRGRRRPVQPTAGDTDAAKDQPALHDAEGHLGGAGTHAPLSPGTAVNTNMTAHAGDCQRTKHFPVCCVCISDAYADKRKHRRDTDDIHEGCPKSTWP